MKEVKILRFESSRMATAQPNTFDTEWAEQKLTELVNDGYVIVAAGGAGGDKIPVFVVLQRDQ